AVMAWLLTSRSAPTADRAAWSTPELTVLSMAAENTATETPTTMARIGARPAAGSRTPRAAPRKATSPRRAFASVARPASGNGYSRITTTQVASASNRGTDANSGSTVTAELDVPVVFADDPRRSSRNTESAAAATTSTSSTQRHDAA